MQPPEIITDFETASQELLDQLAAITPAELNRVPFEGSWTAGQLGVHLSKSYGLAGIFNGHVEPPQRPVTAMLPGIRTAFLDFTIKFQSPEYLVPPDEPVDRDRLLNSLTEKRTFIIQAVHGLDISMLCLDFDLPGVGPLTRLEWVGFLAVHTRRHLHQLAHICLKLEEAAI